jgi:hypothetical protein
MAGCDNESLCDAWLNKRVPRIAALVSEDRGTNLPAQMASAADGEALCRLPAN